MSNTPAGWDSTGPMNWDDLEYNLFIQHNPPSQGDVLAFDEVNRYYYV